MSPIIDPKRSDGGATPVLVQQALPVLFISARQPAMPRFTDKAADLAEPKLTEPESLVKTRLPRSIEALRSKASHLILPASRTNLDVSPGVLAGLSEREASRGELIVLSPLLNKKAPKKSGYGKEDTDFRTSLEPFGLKKKRVYDHGRAKAAPEVSRPQLELAVSVLQHAVEEDSHSQCYSKISIDSAANPLNEVDRTLEEIDNFVYQQQGTDIPKKVTINRKCSKLDSSKVSADQLEHDHSSSKHNLSTSKMDKQPIGVSYKEYQSQGIIGLRDYDTLKGKAANQEQLSKEEVGKLDNSPLNLTCVAQGKSTLQRGNMVSGRDHNVTIGSLYKYAADNSLCFDDIEQYSQFKNRLRRTFASNSKRTGNILDKLKMDTNREPITRSDVRKFSRSVKNLSQPTEVPQASLGKKQDPIIRKLMESNHKTKTQDRQPNSSPYFQQSPHEMHEHVAVTSGGHSLNRDSDRSSLIKQDHNSSRDSLPTVKRDADSALMKPPPNNLHKGAEGRDASIPTKKYSSIILEERDCGTDSSSETEEEIAPTSYMQMRRCHLNASLPVMKTSRQFANSRRPEANLPMDILKETPRPPLSQTKQPVLEDPMTVSPISETAMGPLCEEAYFK